VQTWVERVLADGATDVRVNQEQVTSALVRVGRNRPDLQFTLNGRRYYVEWDTPSSGRGPFHAGRIFANDRSATGVLELSGDYQLPNLSTLKEHVILITMP